jgi:DNA-binding GntR family transcriptional regulator
MLDAKMDAIPTEMERVFQQIKTKIAEGEFLPGERLTEQYLSDTLETSRYTVKLALTKLEEIGVVKQTPYKGYVVSRISLEESVELLKARGLIEGLIGSISAQKITDKEISELEKILFEMNKAIRETNYDEYSKLNTQFHNVIYRSTKNASLADIAMRLKMRIIRYQYKISYIPGRADTSIREHEEIFKALKLHNSELSGKLMTDHVNSVLQSILSNYNLMVI